ncbi:MAG: DUF5996 family protein [Solirubrobacteraceae bacterium]
MMTPGWRFPASRGHASASVMTPLWPALSYSAWRETCDTLHGHTQVLGKLAVAPAPPVTGGEAFQVGLEQVCGSTSGDLVIRPGMAWKPDGSLRHRDPTRRRSAALPKCQCLRAKPASDRQLIRDAGSLQAGGHRFDRLAPLKNVLHSAAKRQLPGPCRMAGSVGEGVDAAGTALCCIDRFTNGGRSSC